MTEADGCEKGAEGGGLGAGSDLGPRADLGQGVAPIRTEFLFPADRKKREYADGQDESAGNAEDAVRKRGQNPQRTKINRQGCSQNSVSGSLCPASARGEICARSETCKYDHDVDAFMRSRPEDLGDACPNVLASGACRFGLLCRFASGHPAGMPLAPGRGKEEAEAALLSRIRKRDVPFPGTDAFMSALRREQQAGAEPDRKEEASTAGRARETYPFGERGRIDFRDKLYLAPLTTVGNLPFRRICKEMGADVTCGEMAMCTNILRGQASEWALLRRHESEDLFGVQVCGGWTDSMTQCAELLNDHLDCDFVDVNMGCPIDVVFKKGMGSGLMDKTNRVRQIVAGMRSVLKDKPLTVKVRIGIDDGKPLAQKLLPVFAGLGVDALTIHGRTRKQRYTKEADWGYISQLVEQARPHGLPIIGNGDVLSFEDYVGRREGSGVAAILIARGALIKPWLFTEIKERRTWDIRSTERLALLQRYVRYGLEHFGSDTAGVERTRRFLLEWLSFLCRYVPAGILERLPQRINDRPPAYLGRDDLETLMASPSVVDWVRISEMLLGPVPAGFVFLPKHRSSSYEQPVTQG